ncbi:uncharacterized protein LOC105179348 isoform X2 [Sesamum indicum]|uniref:Uncharacterized protein LOC105179348 isoform X2 n=1 Tax=Sesamum indicum TaxID=4182 RepID=A0A6I9UP71_SESIN|nr:uncharacterized protein LOC105179348 isoform X2 [Sesamum indicum]
MDFHSMKRKELQALCKKHKIPANLSNLEMATKLQEYFRENGTSLTEGLINDHEENASETETADVVINRRVKKVRFSPDHEIIEFTREKKRTSRRILVSSRNSSSAVENVDSGEVNNEGVCSSGRLTRSRRSKLMEGEVIERKKGTQSVNLKNNRAAIENFNNGDSREGDVFSLGAEMQDRGELLVEGVKNLRKGGRKRASDDDGRDKKVLHAANYELIHEIVHNPGKVTRSRGQKLMEASTRKENRGRKVSVNHMVTDETNENGVFSSSFRSRGIVVEEKLVMGSGVRVKNNGKGCEEVMDNKESAALHVMAEPQILLRRSKRNATKVGVSVISNHDTMKQETGGVKGLRKTPKLLAAEGSGVDEESTGSKVDCDGRAVLQIEEPVKLHQRRSNRRKNVIASHENGNCQCKAETENGYPLTNSVLQLGMADGVSKDNEKAHQPAWTTRRSRQKSSSLNPVSGNEKFDTDSAAKICETKMHLSKPCLVEKGSPTVQKNMRRSRRDVSKNESKEILDEFGGDSIIQQKNGARKRERGPISGGDVIKTDNDPISLKRSMRRESRSEKPEPKAAISKVADETNPPSRWKEPNMDASSHESLLESFVDAQLPMTEVAESTITKDIVSEGLTSSGKTHTEKEDVTLADNAGRTDIKLINGNQLENSDENAAPNIAKLKTDSGKLISSCKLEDVEKVNSLLDSDVQKLIDKNISDTDKNDPEVQMSSQTQDSSCNNIIDDQALLEVSNVCANAGFAESILLDNQTDFKMTEAEADKHIERCLDVVDHVVKVEGVPVQENLNSAATENANFISSLTACYHNDVESEAEADKHIEPSLDVVDHVVKVEGVPVQENLNSAATENANFISSLTACYHNDVESEAEADKYIEPSLDVVHHVAKVEGIPVQENMDSAATEHANSVSSSTACHHSDVESEAEADKYIEPSLDVVHHVAKVEGIPVQENMDSAATEHANLVSSLTACHHSDVDHLEASNIIFENNNEDTPSKAGELGALESCERHVDSSDSKRALQLKEPSSDKLGRSFEGDNTAEGDDTYFHKGIDSELAETDEVGCFHDHKSASNEDSESTVPDVSNGERSASIIPQDRGNFSVNSDEQGMENDSPVVTPIIIHINSDEVNLRRCFKADHIEREETYSYKSTPSDIARTNEGRSSMGHKSKCHEYGEFSISNLFDAERSVMITPQDREIFSGEDSIKQRRFNEDDQIAEGDEIYPHEPNSDSEFQGTVPPTSNMCEDIDKETGAADSIQEKEVSILGVNTLGDEMSMEETAEDGELENFNQAGENNSKDTHEPVERPNTPLAKPTADTIQGHEASNNESVTAGHAMSISKTNGEGKTSEVEGSNIKKDANDANCGKDKEDIADPCISDGAISADASKGIKSLPLPQLNFQDTEETERQCNNPQSGRIVSEGCEERTSVQSSQSWTEIELNSLFETTVNSITPAGLKYTSSQGTETLNLTMSMNRSLADSGEMEGERESQCAKTQYENVVLPTDQENRLKLLFESPIKIIDAISGRDTELDRTVMSFKECIDPTKQIESDEELADAGREVDKGFYPGNSSSEKVEDVTNDELKEFDSVELENNCMSTVLSEAEVDGCEASEEQFTESTCNCKEETNSVTEENKEEMIISLGDACLYEEATEDYSASTEKNIRISSGSMRNSDKDENCTDKLIDTDLSENFSHGSRFCGISEGTMTPSSEAAGGLSDADHQKSNVPQDNHCDNSCNKDVNILRETSADNLRGPLDPEIATCGSFEGSSPNLFTRASHDNGDITETKDAKSIKEDGDPCEAKIWDEKDGNPRSSHDTSDKLPTNSEMANFESLSVGYSLCQEVDKLTTILQLQSTSKETMETGTTILNIDKIVLAEGCGPSVYSAECDTLSTLVIHASQGNTENGDVEHLEVESPVLDLERDDEKNHKEVKETSSATIITFCNESPDFEDKIVEFNNDIQTLSDVPDSGYSEILKESDVADAIKEYIDSESSLSLHFNGSSASHHIDVLTHSSGRNACENAALGESDQEDIGVLSNSEGEDDKPSVEALEAESKELEEATLSMELVPGSKKLVKSPACINLLGEEGSSCHKPSVETKGFAVNNTSETNHRSSSKQSCLTAKNKARTILIHGTPRKLMTVADMKENAATHKRSNNIGDFTTTRPAKRRALQDVHWK